MPEKITDAGPGTGTGTGTGEGATRARLRQAFERPHEFTTSPLYRALSRTVAAEEPLLELASRGRPGQYPTFLFFGAVHQLLLSGVDHQLAAFYPSVVGADRAKAPTDGAGPALLSFCQAHEPELTELISTRLVQTNQVQRSLGLRFGLSAIAPEVPGPVHLVEVGASAGLNLRFDRYGGTVGGRSFGDPDSPVRLVADHYGTAPLPDLDVLPDVASVLGVDLNPIDVLDADARRWLEALVWPENHDQRALLTAALDLVAADPPAMLRGDAIDVLPRLARTLPAGEPRVVFHSATRMHVPADRLDAFDAAIASLGDTGPLWWLSVEDAPDPDPRPAPARPGAALHLRAPDGHRRTLAVVEGHLRWLETVATT
jgi:hypothetical protein